MDNISAKIVILDTQTNVAIEMHCIDLIAALKLQEMLKKTDSYKENKRYQFSIETL